MVNEQARLSIQLGIVESIITDPEYRYDTGIDADYTTPLTDKVHAFKESLAFLEPMYRWMARARFETPEDEARAAFFAAQIKAVLVPKDSDEGN